MQRRVTIDFMGAIGALVRHVAGPLRRIGESLCDGMPIRFLNALVAVGEALKKISFNQ